MKGWSIKEVERVTGKKLDLPKDKGFIPKPIPAGIMFIKNHLTLLKIDFVQELVFSNKRKFRFDIAVPEILLAVEYEGLNSVISGHTTITGYTKDCTKYNLAQKEGWTVLRYTMINYKDFPKDLKEFIKLENNKNANKMKPQNLKKIPDTNFRNCLKNLIPQSFDGNLLDINSKEVKERENLTISRNGIKDLTGIEYFTALEYLDCCYNKIDFLDVSKNMALRHLYCSKNQLKTLDVSKNKSLMFLYCSKNQLVTLDVSKKTALTYLNFDKNVTVKHWL